MRGLGGNVGVEAYTGDGAGVWARSFGGVGVRGVSRSDAGIFGSSDGFTGVAAVSNSRWFGAYAQAWNGTGLVAAGRRGLWAEGNPAAQLVGDVIVNGNLIVTGWKAAAIPQRDGARRLLHALESPDPRFEDFGRARLRRGRARVRLDPAFASAIQTSDYHVFLTAEGECEALFVARRTSHGFEVRDRGGGRSGARFSYRVVGKRRDVPGRRFARTVLPASPVLPETHQTRHSHCREVRTDITPSMLDAHAVRPDDGPGAQPRRTGRGARPPAGAPSEPRPDAGL